MSFCLLQEVVMATMVILAVWLQVAVIAPLLLRRQVGLLVCISAMIMPLRMWRFLPTVIPSVVSKPLQAILFLCIKYILLFLFFRHQPNFLIVWLKPLTRTFAGCFLLYFGYKFRKAYFCDSYLSIARLNSSHKSN